ncbi:hypothetical protein OV090_14210 [Nannocystis sp. RBIL2]|uniref:hypothetical protein n=1 Tax=Nannocystis sp. RBIL2 TaxID=2996788 RepID=UPI0022711F10|nr:hypothetical protein [Nannocystis sp. RBIL2]MCY1065931.1 hypothetical protein [Nannocystis sp. RBIL2]
MYFRTWFLMLVGAALAGCGDPSEPILTDSGATQTTTAAPSTDGASSTGGASTTDGAGGSHACGSLLANNDADCVCDPGYERCEPGTDNTDCCKKQGMGDGACPDPNSTLDGEECFCNDGYTWCNPDSPDDLSCCVDPDQTTATPTEATSDATSEGTSGGEACPDAVDPPPSCAEDSESFYCTNPSSCGPQGSAHYVCEGGVWAPDTSLDQTCQLDGYDFAYGCVDDGGSIYVECGSGSGAACSGEAPSCQDANTWVGCKWGKTSEVDCFVACTEIGDDMGATYDHGACEVQDGEAVCACCDAGDPGCPI